MRDERASHCGYQKGRKQVVLFHLVKISGFGFMSLQPDLLRRKFCISISDLA
jgi:hypothetical protein